jgi:hypothetical protein
VKAVREVRATVKLGWSLGWKRLRQVEKSEQ